MAEAARDRRQAHRAHLAIPIELRDTHGFSLHAAENVSEGGAFFERAIPHQVGSRVQVSLQLPGEVAIECEGEVVNVPDQKDFGMGVRFIGMSVEDRTRLRAFTTRYDRTK